MNQFLQSAFFSIVWALFIAILCSIPGTDLPSIGWLELISFDKFVHAFLFFVQFYFTSKAICNNPYSRTKRHHHHKLAFAFCVFYGGILELLQGAIFIERSADIFDFIANTAGATISYFIFKNRIKSVFTS